MSEEAPTRVPSLEKYGPLMKKEEVAEALHLPRHIIAPLARAGLLEPYGKPRRYCVKFYSRDVLAKHMVDQQWLNQLAAAIHQHWRNKNARKRAKQAGISRGIPARDSA
jgi:hypothetical protein